MEKWFFKIDSSDEFRTRKVIDDFNVQYSALKYTENSEVLFAICSTVTEQKAIISRLKRAKIDFIEVS